MEGGRPLVLLDCFHESALDTQPLRAALTLIKRADELARAQRAALR